MDLASLMNDDSATDQRNHRSTTQDTAHASSRSTPHAYGTPPLKQHDLQSRPTPPAYAPPRPSLETHHSGASVPQLSHQSSVQTPFLNPSTSTGYFRSPVQTHAYRGDERWPSTTPGGHPAQNHSYPQTTPTNPFPLQSMGLSKSGTLSQTSRTPPSAPGHSPYGARESPFPPAYHTFPPAGQQSSQPNTPSGRPSSQYRRQSLHREGNSPFATVHRTHSGASTNAGRSAVSNSPAPPFSALSSMTQSPVATGHPDYATRRYGEHASVVSERERSTSVSPKTTFVRTPSDAIRQSAPNIIHVDHGRNQHPHYQSGTPSLYHHDSQPPPPIQPSSRTNSEVSVYGAQPAPVYSRQSSHQSPVQPHSIHRLLSEDHPTTAKATHMPPPQRGDSSRSYDRSVTGENVIRVKQEQDHIEQRRDLGDESLLRQPFVHDDRPMDEMDLNAPRPMKEQSQISDASPQMPAKISQEPTSQKRPAEDDLEVKPVPKKTKREHAEPPIWARLAPSNPRYTARLALQPGMQKQNSSISPGTVSQAPPVRQPPPSNINGEMNGGPPIANEIDDEKSSISRLLGMKWEMSYTDTVPSNDVLTTIGNFLYIGMLARQEVGAGDVRNGALEIEAKLGSLIDRNTEERLALPVTTMTTLHEQFSASRVRFASFMTESQHKSMNEYLNKCVQSSMQRNRTPMIYQHRFERDSFSILNQAGLNALPPVAHSHMDTKHSNPRLRTTVDVNPRLKASSPPVIARIVKVRLADLDIYSPSTDFDCRISINIEIDLNGRTDIDPSMIVKSSTDSEKEKEKFDDRFKNRLSYKHLAYSIDLTQVSSAQPTAPKTHELEVEVDAALLRRQALLLKDGKENAFEGLVKGFMDNVVMLMRFKAPPEDGAQA